MKSDLDAIVVGAGFAGLYMVHKLRELGYRVRAFEAGAGVGGTWFWNRYPGARCDVESMEYSYQFSTELEQEWEWSERYAPQPEILAYANHVADRFGLLEDIQLNTRVESAHWDEATGRWRISTDDGRSWTARFCIMATGCLSSTHMPEIEGLDAFEGELYHTGRWPTESVDFRGKRVGVIGTGSSGIQAIPLIAEEADSLVVFQRTANFSVPAQNHPLDPEVQRAVKADYPAIRAKCKKRASAFGLNWGPSHGSALACPPERRRELLEERWAKGGLGFVAVFDDLMKRPESNELVAEFVREKIRSLVKDPEIAEQLCPDHVLSCKRPCSDTGYYETFNRPNVELVDVSREPIEEITPRGVVTGGRERALDAIVLATGFDAMTGALLSIDIRGRGGQTLGEKWSAGPVTYLGLGTSGFPNFFTITGPGSPSVLANMITAIEQHVEWIADCLEFMRAKGYRSFEVTRAAEDEWVAHVNSIADATLYPTCNSWYLGANVPGKPRVFMPHIGFPPYVEKCDEVAALDYEGFRFESA